MENLGVWIGIVVLIYASGMFWLALSLKYYTQFGPGPGLFPLWLSGILIVITLLFIWQSVKHDAIRFWDVFPNRKAFRNVLSVWGSILLFMILLNYTGFTIASSILLYTLFIRGYKWHWALGLSIGVSVFLFLAFNKAFGIPLPVNALGW
ncbi:hypothetical protein AXX12_09585 [Anaerosporomusa subterranea]|uniref:DUF1468 domain-containing protein n=1 Tax=Anaerosporomusa subterranea TaxID=1794912 RepID=A0A154BRU8_ANASB|nr:tripartite tricarboxylate transporter TctB family protein [Anaerosporomusa subterranea]KYZ76661.1 hypothetical protein AXX12_09585 [Anaerosporomusa subterranea]